MSIEAMKQALEALQGGYGDTKSWHKAIESAIKALRTAIQQAEAQQPAVGERLGWLFQHEETGLTQVVDCQQVEWGFEANNPRWQKIRQVYDHQAPSVPDDVVRDAERYRWLRDLDHWPAPFSSSQEPEPVRGRDLDEAIDAAMLAAQDSA